MTCKGPLVESNQSEDYSFCIRGARSTNRSKPPKKKANLSTWEDGPVVTRGLTNKPWSTFRHIMINMHLKCSGTV